MMHHINSTTKFIYQTTKHALSNKMTTKIEDMSNYGSGVRIRSYLLSPT